MLKAMHDEVEVLRLLGMSAMPLDGKKPTIKAWERAATADLFAKIKKGNNFGIRTGAHSNCLVVDVDTKDRGLEIWTALEAKMGHIDTYRVRTGSGGLHMYFDYAGTKGIKNGAKLVKYNGIKVGIDVKNDHGQVVAALSIHPDTKKIYEAEVSLREYEKTRADQSFFAPLPDWLRGLITGETVLSEDYSFLEVPKEAPNVDRDEDFVAIGVTLEFIEALVMKCLKPERADDYDDWRNVVMALSHAAMQYKVKTKLLAHDFSKQSKKYDAKSVDALCKETPTEGKCCTLGTIRFMAKADNPELYETLRASISTDAPVKPTCWQDLPKMRTSKPTLAELMAFFRGCVFEVVGSTTQYFARQRDGSILAIPKPFVAKGEDFDVPLANGKSVSLFDVFKSLGCEPCWTRNVYDRVDNLLSFTDEITIPGVLNLFTGYPCKPVEGMNEDAEFVLSHIENILCAGNKEFSTMLECWFGHLTQKPGVKIEIMPMFLGEQGTGKSIVFDKLFPLLVGNRYHEIDDMDELFDRFNVDQQNKDVCLLNEIGTYGKDHKQSGKMKSVLTRKKRKIEGKGTNKYEVSDTCNYILASNKDNPVKIETSNRRYAPITTSSEKIGDVEYFNKLNLAINAESVSRLLHRWLNIDISKWNKSKIPKTDAMQAMKDMALSPTLRFMIEIANGQTDLIANGQLKIHSCTLFQSFTNWCADGKENQSISQKIFSAELVKMKIPYGEFRMHDEKKCGFRVSLEILQQLLRTALREPERSFTIAALPDFD